MYVFFDEKDSLKDEVEGLEGRKKGRSKYKGIEEPRGSKVKG